MSNVSERKLDWKPQFDVRSRAFSVRNLVQAAVPQDKLWRPATNFWLDQGQEGACVGNGWANELGCTPIRYKIDQALATRIYAQAKKLDEWDGENYDGTSVLAGAKAASDFGFVKEYHWAFNLMDALLALSYKGPLVIGVNWYCVTPEQRILTTDLRWVPAGKIRRGDEVIGFDEDGGHRAKYRRAVVTSNRRIIRPVYEITTDRGVTTVSAEHKFIKCHRDLVRQWATAESLRPGDRLAYFMDPFDEDESWEAGWLAGFFDGEGTLSCGRLDVSQAVGPTLERAQRIIEAKGYEAITIQKRGQNPKVPQPEHWKDVHVLYVTGPYAGALRFLGQMRPGRLLEKSHVLWEGKQTVNKRATPVVVQSVRYVGEEEVCAVGTSTKTLIVEGLLSHNSGMFDTDANGFVKVTGQVEGGHCVCVHAIDTKNKTVTFRNSWGKDWGVNGGGLLSWADLERLISEQGEVCVPTDASQVRRGVVIFDENDQPVRYEKKTWLEDLIDWFRNLLHLGGK